MRASRRLVWATLVAFLSPGSAVAEGEMVPLLDSAEGTFRVAQNIVEGIANKSGSKATEKTLADCWATFHERPLVSMAQYCFAVSYFTAREMHKTLLTGSGSVDDQIAKIMQNMVLLDGIVALRKIGYKEPDATAILIRWAEKAGVPWVK